MTITMNGKALKNNNTLENLRRENVIDREDYAIVINALDTMLISTPNLSKIKFTWEAPPVGLD
jgi:hypothetical protein